MHGWGRVLLSVVAAFAVAACEASGPNDRAAFEAQVTGFLPATDNRPTTIARVRYVNMRTVPSLSEQIWMGAQARPGVGAAVVTPRTFYLLYWVDRQQTYAPFAAMPLDAIVEVRLHRALLGVGLGVESREPMFMRAGRPDQTSLVRITVIPADGLVNLSAETEELATALDRAVESARRARSLAGRP